MQRLKAFLAANWWKFLIAAVAIMLVHDKYESSKRAALLRATLTQRADKRAEAADPETKEKLSNGMSRECIAEEHAANAAGIDKKVREDQERLAKMGVLSTVVPVDGPLGAAVRRAANLRAPKIEFPPVRDDVIAQLGMTLENRFDGHFGVTDAAIRGMADRAAAKLGLLDETGLRGYTLSVRVSDNGGANTTFDVEKKVAVINVGVQLLNAQFDHEFAHVLSGPDFLMNRDIATAAKETVAIAAEFDDASPGLRETWSYARQNLAILGMGRSINGESGVMHASGAPLDGWRYDLVRLTDEVIGEEAQVALARRVWAEASARRSYGMRDLEARFVDAGVKDLAIFKEQVEPGLYLDLGFQVDGVPVILAKTVDADGYEGLTNVPMQIIWRDAEGQAVGGMDPIPLQPAFQMNDAALMASYASSIEVRVSGQPYVFQLDETVASSSKSARPANTATKFH